MRRHYTEAIVIPGSAPEKLVARVKACDTALDRREHRLVRPSSVMSGERIIEDLGPARDCVRRRKYVT
jgi:hypothetical protein